MNLHVLICVLKTQWCWKQIERGGRLIRSLDKQNRIMIILEFAKKKPGGGAKLLLAPQFQTPMKDGKIRICRSFCLSCVQLKNDVNPCKEAVHPAPSMVNRMKFIP